MSEHAVYCIDHPRAGELSGADHLAGWLLCSKQIEAVEMPGDLPATFTYGLSRPDVATSYSLYPNAARSGFRLQLAAGQLAAGPPASADGFDLVLVVTGSFGLRSRLRLRLDPGTNDVQQAVLDNRPGGALRRRKSVSGFSARTLEQRLDKSLAAGPGLVFRLDIINKCNLRCVMCRYSDPSFGMRTTRKLTPEQFRHIFEDIAPYTRGVMLSCADEPLMSNHFSDIVSYLADEHPHVEISLCTNAMLMNAGIRRLLVAKGVAHVFFSMDGVYKETLEGIRVGSKYERVGGNILALRDLKRESGSERPAIIMNFVMMNDNIHEAPAFVELAARLGACLIDFRQSIPNEYLDDPRQYLVNHKAKYNYYRRKIRREAKRHKIDLILPPPFNTAESFDPGDLPAANLGEFEALAPDPASGEAPAPRKVPKSSPRSPAARKTAAEVFAKTFCNRPFSEILIDDQELVKPCPWYNGHLGRLSEGKTLGEIFRGPEARRLRRNMLDPNGDHGCRGCPIKAESAMAGIAEFKNPGEKLRRLLRQFRSLLS